MAKKKPRINAILEKIWTDPKHPAGFGSPRLLYNALKKVGHKNISMNQIKEWLSTKNAYTMHKRIIKRFSRRRVISSSVTYQGQSDLTDVAAIKKENNGYTFLLTFINCLTREAQAVAIKSKSSKDMIPAFAKILKKLKFIPLKLQTDDGKEFLSLQFQQYLRKRKISHFTTSQDPKASLIERFHSTLK